MLGILLSYRIGHPIFFPGLNSTENVVPIAPLYEVHRTVDAAAQQYRQGPTR